MNAAFRAPAARSLLVYALLVGLPLAALLAILRAGRSLQAPPSIGGAWTVDAASSTACAAQARALRDGGIVLSQSGVHLSAEVRLDAEHRLSGRLTGDTLTAEADQTAFSVPPRATCDPDFGLRLAARVDPSGRWMRGALRFTRCAACDPIAFTASRTPAGRRGGAR